MDCEIKQIKKKIELKLQLHELKFPAEAYRESEEIRKRIRSISSKIPILQKYASSDDLAQLCNRLLESIKKLPKPTVSEKLNNTENLLKTISRLELELIQRFLVRQQMNEEDLNQVVSSLNDLDPRLDLTEKMRLVYEKHVFQEATNLTFIVAWEIHLFPYLVPLFRLHDLEYLKNFSRARITYNNRDSDLVQLKDIVNLTVIFIENSKNYKFFLQASLAYSSRNRVRIEETQKLKEYEIELIFTSYQTKPPPNSSGLLKLDTSFIIGPKGLKQVNNEELLKTRNDGFVTIGNHCFADIELPVLSDHQVVLSSVIFWRNSNYYIQDLSKEFSVLRRLKLKKHYEIRPEMIFVISRLHYLRILSTKDERLNGQAHSSLFFEFVKGPYSEVMGDSQECRMKDFQTATKPPTNNAHQFTIGKGGQNNEADFLISFDKTVSRKHLVFIYSRKSNQWTVCDIDSKNGSFMLIKEYPQIINQQQSYARLLLPDFLEEKTNCDPTEAVTIQNLNFYIRPPRSAS